MTSKNALQIEYIDPMKLIPNPRNVKQHTDKQIDLIVRSMEGTGGSVVPIVVDENMVVMSGHGRLFGHKRRGDLLVPVIRVTGLSEAQKTKFMLADNQLNAMTGNDTDALAMLLQEMNKDQVPLTDIGFSEAELDKLLGYDADNDVDDLENAGEEAFGMFQLKESLSLHERDCVGPYGLPSLMEHLIPEIGDSFTVWMNRHRTTDNGNDFLHMHGRESSKGLDPERTVVGFYIDDHRFDGVWSNLRGNTQRFLNAGVKALIMPDFTRIDGWPLPVNLWAVYRNFYCALYWQEAGLHVIPNLTDWNLESVPGCCEPIPRGCATVSIQMQTVGGVKEGRTLRYSAGDAKGVDEETARTCLELSLDLIKPQTLLVYGGARGLQIGQAACKRIGVRFVGVENRATASAKAFSNE